MRVTLFRNGLDASGRPFRETLPVGAVGRDHGLLMPADHDMGVIGPQDIADTLDGRDRFRLNAKHPARAGSVAVKPAFTNGGGGLWLLKIPDKVLGSCAGLEVLIEEVETSEHADPPSFEDLARVPVPRRLGHHDIAADPSPTAIATQSPATPAAAVTGLHHGGARMRATFDLSGWADG